MNPRILLINPRINEASQNRRINAIVGITFPSSIGVLAGCLLEEGIEEVEIIDEQLDPIPDADLPGLLERMASPKIVGISTLTLNSSRAYELAAKIKAVDPNTLVVLGGIHPTVATAESLNAQGVDVVIRGEAEVSFTQFVKAVLNGEEYRGIQGLSYKRGGVPFHNPDAPLVDNLDDIPSFPYHLFEKNLHRYPSFSSVTGSRGCPYKCTFCSSRSISGKKYRFHSVERVVEEIKTLVRKYGQSSVFFMDDNIAVKKKHFYELCDALIREGLHKEAFFHGSMRGDNATDDILLKAKEANFKIIYYGLETGVERLMKLIDKGETVQEVIDAIWRADRIGMQIGTTIIFGLPTETRKDRWDTIRLVRSLPIVSVRFNTMAPYPGTPAFNTLHPQGKVLIKPNWENFGVQYLWESDDIPYVPDESRRLELIFDTMYANLSSYLTWKGIWKMIKSPVAGGNVIRLENRWYFSPRQLYKLASAFIYLMRRFISVTVRMFWGMAFKKG